MSAFSRNFAYAGIKFISCMTSTALLSVNVELVILKLVIPLMKRADPFLPA